MATRQFDAILQANATYTGERWWNGTQIHSAWNVLNLTTTNYSVWGLDANGWLQYKSSYNSYALRYNPYDVDLSDYYFETEIQPSGTGNYEVGFAFRFKDRFNFYYLTFNGGYQDWGGKNIRLMKVTGSTHIKIAEYECPVFDTTKIYRFRLDLVGGNIVIKLNDVEIFNYTDANPILKGAFGPIVKGQEFAKWRGFQAKSITNFLVSKKLEGLSLTNNYYDVPTSKLLMPQTVQEFLQSEIDTYLSSRNYMEYAVSEYVAYSSNNTVKVIFDRILDKVNTANGTSRVYAYQVLPVTAPLPATNLQGRAESPTEILLTWSHSDWSEDGFYIQDENGRTLYTLGEDVTEFRETGLDEGTTYKRKVVAFNNAGVSAPTNLIAVTTNQTLPNAPADLVGTALNDKSIKWSWTDTSFNENNFELVTWNEAGDVVVIATIPSNVTEYIETGLTFLTSYSRAIRSTNTAGMSGLSETATAQTLDYIPDPPSEPPVNFYGVGVADDSIVWSWEYLDGDADGFEILDEKLNVIARIPLRYSYTELSLYSSMVYKRKVRAYNRGGVGPTTDFATAKTLGYGYDYTGRPVAPMNLVDNDYGEDYIELAWDYEDDKNMPAIGFKIYDELDVLVETLTVDLKTRVIGGLAPDTTYSFYIVAYNEVGDSLPSNLVTVSTLPEEKEDDVVEEEPQETLDDPLYGLTYDHEQPNAPKIRAFQSGVGDKMDLVVKNLFTEIPNFEEFIYEMYIKGYYQENSFYYPEVPFQFRVTCEGIDTLADLPYKQQSEWYSATVQGEAGGTGITFQSSLSMRLPATITSKEYSVEVRDLEGNSIPSYKAGKPHQKVDWILDPYEVEEMVGVVNGIYMKNVYQDWEKFSHQGTLQPSNAAELGAWAYNPTTDELLCTENTGTFVGSVSPDYYDNFTINAMFRSDHQDNDAMALIIAFAIDESGREHTLSAVRNHTLQNKWGLYYNFRQSNEILLAEDAGFPDMYDFWDIFYPGGSIVEVSKYGNIVEARTSIAGTETLGFKLRIDLNSLPELAIFKGPKPIGVASWSQEHAALKIRTFVGEKTERYTAYNLRAWTVYTENKGVYKEWQSAKVVSSVQKINAFETLNFIARIQSPQYQIPWQELNKEYVFNPNMYKVVITSNNPNIELKIETDVIDFFPEDSTFVNVPMSARIINHTQTSWYPYAHNGYYYLNEKEHFLYGDDKARLEKDGSLASYIYTFPYVIKAYGERNYRSGEISFIDDTAMHFMVGNLGDGVDVDADNGTLTLQSSADEGIFESRMFDFEMPITNWSPIEVTMLQNEGYPITLEVGVADEYGVVANWHPQEVGSPISLPIPAERIRYRIKMRAGQKAQPYTMNFNLNNTVLNEGFTDKVTVNDKSIAITDPEFMQVGTYVTKPLEYGPLISDMGIITIEMDIPGTSRVELYSVSNANREHDFKNPTSDSPWIPLELVSKVGNLYTYRIKSMKHEWVSIVAKLYKGQRDDVSSTAFVLNERTWDPTLATNLWNVGGKIQLYNKNEVGRYQTRALNIGDVEFFAPIEFDFTKEDEGDTVELYSITGDNAFDLQTLANDDANWKLVTNNVIQSSPKKWVMYRLVLKPGTSTSTPSVTSLIVKPMKSTAVTPTLNNMVVKAQLFNWIRTVPVIDKVKVGAAIQEGFGAEDFLIPMTGELLSDGDMHDLTDKRVDVIALEWLAAQGVANLNELILKDFLVDVDPIYPVELSADRSGMTVVSGKTTAPVGDLIWQQEKLYFDSETHDIVLQPIPQTGCPIVITNAQGRQLRPVHFRDKNGNATLVNIEEHVTDETQYIFTEYTDIDKSTLHVYIDLENEGVYEEVLNCRLEENRIILPFIYNRGLNLKVQYRLKDSFCIHYNYAPERDSVKIEVHTAFDSEVKATRLLTVQYETQKEHPYHLLNEVNLNPLHTKIHSGFVYLTDEIYEPYKVDIYANPTTLYTNREDTVTVNAFVYDEFHNPVVGETVTFTCNSGSLDLRTTVTDANGMVTAIYKADPYTVATQDAIQVNVIGRSAAAHLTNSIAIDLVKEEFINQLVIVPEKRMVSAGDVVQLKVIAMGPNNERLVNKDVSLSVGNGTVTPSSGKTNPEGELFFMYSVPADITDNFVVLEARSLNDNGKLIKEQNILGVSGV